MSENDVQEDERKEELEKTKGSDMVTAANLAAERLEAANREKERLLIREEALRVEQTLGGKADAGEPAKTEETPEEYAKKLMSGELNVE